MNPIYVLALMSLAMVAGVAAEGDAKDLLETLCRRERDGPEVTHVSQVKSIAEVIESDQTFVCDKPVLDAIKRLVEVVKLTNVCSSKASDTMIAFWKVYGKKKSEIRKDLPKPLKKFFIGFLFQTSKVCKQTLMRELEKATLEKGITAQDTRIISEPALAKVYKFFSDLRVDNLMIIVRAAHSKKLKLKPVKMDKDGKRFYKMQRELCVNKFQPIYENLISPIVKLASIGFSFNGDSLNTQMLAFQETQLYKNWFGAVLACEATSMIYPVEIADTALDADGNAVMTVLDDNDIAELEKETGQALEEPAIEAHVDYQVGSVQVDDLVLNRQDKEMKKAIRKYKYALTSVTAFRARMMKKVPSILKLVVEEKVLKFGLKKFGSSEDEEAEAEARRKSKLWGMMTLIGGTVLFGAAVTGTVLGCTALASSGWFGLVLLLGIAISAIILVFGIKLAVDFFKNG